MSNQYNLYNFEALFKEYLLAGNAKPVSIKNYLSDLRHFIGWLSSNKDSKSVDQIALNADTIQNLIQTETIREYRSYLQTNAIPLKTINRRLSTLRKFCSFCISQGWMTENVAKNVANTQSHLNNTQDIIPQFETDLRKEGLEQSKITQYLETVQEFLTL